MGHGRLFFNSEKIITNAVALTHPFLRENREGTIVDVLGGKGCSEVEDFLLQQPMVGARDEGINRCNHSPVLVFIPISPY